jgi:hypothetical protein
VAASSTTCSETKRGQALLGAMLALPLALAVAIILLLSLLLFSARMNLRAEAYALARAHLYGNESAHCRSRFWKDREGIFTRFRCNSEGRVEAAFQYQGRTLLNEIVDLSGPLGRGAP